MALAFSYGNNSTIVETRQGKVRGYTYNGMSIFKGIPYATAKRFQAPQPVEPWEGVKDATSYGYVCPLLEMEEPKGELFVPHRYWVMDENCQNLNVWTPACDGEKRPVMVWLHGGGYFAGSSIEQVAYEGENMCKYGQVVVVSINHRLNILGYMDVSAFGEEYANSGNAGSDDMVAALQWIHDNIEKFGGDPDNVTLFGQSGGGSKITTLLQTPAADGLFAKGIIMSGIAGMALEDSTGDGEELAIAMMAELGTEDFHDLETIPYARLAEAYLKVKPEFEAKGKYLGGSPHPNAFYKGEPRINGFRVETSQIPLLIGTVFGEFSSFGLPSYNKHEMTEEQQEGTGSSFEVMVVPLSALLLVLCGLCTSVMWASIFNLATEGLGKYTAQASGIFMMMVVGGGVLPLIQNYIADNTGYMISYIVPLIAMAYMFWYALAGSKNVNTDIPVE